MGTAVDAMNDAERRPSLRTAAVDEKASMRWASGSKDDPVHEEWRRRIIIAFGLAWVLLVWTVARRVSRPVEALARSAEAAQLGGSAPFLVAGPLEVQKAAAAINAMHARIAAQATERMRLMAALAHDLRTPVTALQLRLSSASPKLRDRMQPDLDRMGILMDDSLALARLETVEVERSPIELGEFVRSVQVDRQERGQQIEVGAVAHVMIETDAALLRRALDNLLDNALRYGLLAVVSVESRRGETVLRVQDHGPGIPIDEIGRLMRPFEVLDPARSKSCGGSGLGLSIVADIARKLELGLAFENGPRGLTVELTFA
ncbi:MAG: HAMP domain-containing histidine kinase [Caulobacteraceae bacterium]|nr:HAMP domain-containing histidine kinase [Caulobacteraceae bacterium]